MKKNTIFVIFLLLGILLSGCSTQRRIYSTELKEEEFLFFKRDTVVNIEAKSEGKFVLSDGYEIYIGEPVGNGYELAITVSNPAVRGITASIAHKPIDVTLKGNTALKITKWSNLKRIIVFSTIGGLLGGAVLYGFIWIVEKLKNVM